MRRHALASLLAAALLAAPAAASPRLLASAPLGGGLDLPYYASAPPGPGPQTILIAIHGYTRDATRTFDAAARAAAAAGQASTLIIAPIFQVPAAEADKCRFRGVPAAAPGDALWHCGTWSTGGGALNAPLTSFAAMDSLEATLLARYPTAHGITLAGFSAGGQFVQHYAGFANPPPAIQMRYVVADPSEFVYFDPWRPVPGIAACPGYNDWKYGTDNLPPALGRTAAQARAAYAAADLSYLEGARDTGAGRGTAHKLLETSCAAELEGPYRLQRGQAYAAYDAARLAHGAHQLSIIPGCAHSVTCVFPAPAARAALFGTDMAKPSLKP